MERVFFVDYENVDTKGLDGVSRLTGNDAVYIYYSEKHSRMTFGLHRRIMESQADFYYTKINDNSKNALDNKLIEDSDDVISDKRADYYIISKDKGYGDFVKEKTNEGYRVFLLPDIKECNDAKKKWLKNIVRDRLVDDRRPHATYFDLSDEQIDKIAKWLMDSKSKSELNNHLQEMFYNENIKYIFTRLRDLTYNL